ncbi:MAG TPA: hypothetical protein VEA58_09375 [Anaerovoracaceae bacterium]|nr:hypothetical protein [Anaerovoracaceae bacterium]
MGLGPSLRRHLPILSKIDRDKEKYKIISCNNMDLMTGINFDYWMLAQPAESDNPFCIRNAYNRYNGRPNTMLLYTDCLDLTPRQWVADHLTIEYLGYDQRHWSNEPCSWGNLPGGRHICCDGIIPGRLSIQEYFQKVTGMDHHYGAGDTVGVHMVALAVILGLNPIYVTGIDLDYTHGYVNNEIPNAQLRIGMGISSMNKSPQIVDRVVEDLKIINRSARNLGIDIYDMNGDGRLSEVFEYKSFQPE